MDVRKAVHGDIERISDIYKVCFPRECDHQVWIEASFNSFPRGIYYVIEKQGTIAGYNFWCVKNGFRDKTIIELEQVGIHPDFREKGMGRELIKQSFKAFKGHIRRLGHQTGAVYVTTSEGHFAEDLYRSILGTERAAVIENYGSGNEVILYTIKGVK